MAVAFPLSLEPITALDAPFDDAIDRPTLLSQVGRATTPSTAAAQLREAPTAPGVEGVDVAWDFADSQPPPSVERDPEWCVDLGDGMIALHTVELYARLATRALPADVRVWRCGREAWTPAREVPELRYAIDEDGPGVAPEVDVRGEVDLDPAELEADMRAEAAAAELAADVRTEAPSAELERTEAPSAELERAEAPSAETPSAELAADLDAEIDGAELEGDVLAALAFAHGR